MSRNWKRIKDAGTLALLLVALGYGFVRWQQGSASAAACDPDRSTPAAYDAATAAAQARHAMSAVSAARQLLIGHHDIQAERYLERADRTLATLGHDFPLASATDRITLYSTFTLPADAAQHQVAQRKLRQLAAAVQRGEHDQVIAALRQTGVPIVYRYLDMPLAAIAHQVSEALVALRRRDPGQTAAILDHLEQGMKETVTTLNGATAPASGAASVPGVFSGTATRQASDTGAHT